MESGVGGVSQERETAMARTKKKKERTRRKDMGHENKMNTKHITEVSCKFMVFLEVEQTFLYPLLGIFVKWIRHCLCALNIAKLIRSAS